jgi:hypothetical protein
MPTEALDEVFDAMWPRLETAIKKAREAVPQPPEPAPKTDKMLVKIVDTVRRLERTGHWFPTVTLPSPDELSGRMLSTGTMTATGPDLSGRAYIAGYGPVSSSEEDSSKPED